MNINNKKVLQQMKEFIKEQLDVGSILRYYHTFRRELDYNIYQYGNLDITYHELQERLKDFGVTHRYITGEPIYYFNHKTDWIENVYMSLVRKAVNEIIKEDVLCPTK